MAKSKKPFYADGIKFECQGSGKCCASRGEYGFVYLTLEDRRRMAKVLGVSTQSFTKKYCGQCDGLYHLKEDGSPDCMFLEDNKCGIYEGRPTQCRTWPFWPELMNAKSWRRDVVKFCPGINKGRKYTAREIKQIIDEQVQSENDLLFGN